ncbi:MAG: trypsin-like peptidase domain-containing protein [Bacillota bacterium]|nr:trypsin-like peptidase domain-containing protein [Bacillota bacterium]
MYNEFDNNEKENEADRPDENKVMDTGDYTVTDGTGNNPSEEKTGGAKTPESVESPAQNVDANVDNASRVTNNGEPINGINMNYNTPVSNSLNYGGAPFNAADNAVEGEKQNNENVNGVNQNSNYNYSSVNGGTNNAQTGGNGETPNDFQGMPRYTYSYNPANSYNQANIPPKKKKSGLAIFSIAIGIFIALCLLAVSVTAIIASVRGNKLPTAKTPGTAASDSNKNAKNSNGPSLSINENAPTGTSSSGSSLNSVDIAKKVRPSVVGVLCTSTDQGVGTQSSGSGIVMTAEGYIITNAHVIENAQNIKVVDFNKKEYPAQIIGQDTQTDLAVIKVDAKDLKPAEFGDSDKIEVGQAAMAIGNPMGMELFSSVTEGVISGDKREISLNGRVVELIQTDASINPGNSGGPLVNPAGQVIGINTVKITQSSYEGLGFAIPINFAKPVVDELIKNGYITGRPLIGISGQTVDESMQYFNMPLGVYVMQVDPTSDAYTKGIRNGDIITAINGKEIKSIEELNTEKDKLKAGDKVTLKVYRAGKSYNVDILLSEAKPTKAQ